MSESKVSRCCPLATVASAWLGSSRADKAERKQGTNCCKCNQTMLLLLMTYALREFSANFRRNENTSQSTGLPSGCSLPPPSQGLFSAIFQFNAQIFHLFDAFVFFQCSHAITLLSFKAKNQKNLKTKTKTKTQSRLTM